MSTYEAYIWLALLFALSWGLLQYARARVWKKLYEESCRKLSRYLQDLGRFAKKNIELREELRRRKRESDDADWWKDEQ